MKYGAILADPPWQFKAWSDKGKGRAAEQHYDCMIYDDLCALPMIEWAADDCALFLWVTDPMLLKALQLVEAWGFRYKTVAFYWVKLNKLMNVKSYPGVAYGEAEYFTGLGYWTRANPEMCLLATRGHPKRMAKDVCRLIVAPRREHSRKPDEIYERIERLVSGPYLELFSRHRRPGWDQWGLEPDKFDSC